MNTNINIYNKKQLKLVTKKINKKTLKYKVK